MHTCSIQVGLVGRHLDHLGLEPSLKLAMPSHAVRFSRSGWIFNTAFPFVADIFLSSRSASQTGIFDRIRNPLAGLCSLSSLRRPSFIRPLNSLGSRSFFSLYTTGCSLSGTTIALFLFKHSSRHLKCFICPSPSICAQLQSEVPPTSEL